MMTETQLAKVKEQAVSGATLADQLAIRLLDSENIGTETLREVLKMQNEQEDRRRKHEIEDRAWDAEKKFNVAFTSCKEKMPQVAKDARNSQTSSDYATMEAVDLAITPVMAEHGFAITFKNGNAPRDENHLHIKAILIHKDGHREEYDDQIPIAGIGAKGNRMMTTTHGHGATKTYARRYLKLDIWDVAVMNKDSDGNANNISEIAEDYLAKIGEAKTRKELDDLSATISTDTKLFGADLSRVRKSWALNLKRVG